jgi:hypothetical protein
MYQQFCWSWAFLHDRSVDRISVVGVRRVFERHERRTGALARDHISESIERSAGHVRKNRGVQVARDAHLSVSECHLDNLHVDAAKIVQFHTPIFFSCAFLESKEVGRSYQRRFPGNRDKASNRRIGKLDN